MVDFSPPSGMGAAIFANKYQNPRKPAETFADRAEEVWRCNYALTDEAVDPNVLRMAREGILPTSGRHLQHMIEGETDGIRGEKVTNCSTAMFSFVKFFLLMQGSGVGRSYAHELCLVDWSRLPKVHCYLTNNHPDFVPGLNDGVDLSINSYDRVHVVGDSAEGWAKAVEILEVAAYEGRSDQSILLDFSGVRCSGTPIVGQQGRPASGPIPLIRSLQKVAGLRGTTMAPFEQAMWVDHWMSECVQLGGIRRSARIACKPWSDPLHEVLRFIECKRGGEMWSANNSLLVDAAFWRQDTTAARAIFQAATNAAYFDGTGEPGFINADRLTRNDSDMHLITPKSVLATLDIEPQTKPFVERALSVARKHKFNLIVNPCGEINLHVWGGYCTIADICLANIDSLDDLVPAAQATAEFLVRANTLPFLYEGEVKRTNRIGVSFTGIFEFAWKHWQATFYDLLDPGHPMWAKVREARDAVWALARKYGCHTSTTIKPSGTIGKVMGCTEGAHLPAYGWYMRWVIYPQVSAEADALAAQGYPRRHLTRQANQIIGFPTKMALADLMGDALVLAGDPTPEQHYQWIRLLEANWVDSQVSYTLKYDPKVVDYQTFARTILEQQPTVRCCSVMPQIDMSAYEYQPEERITKAEYDAAMARINVPVATEHYDDNDLLCAGGVCPIELDR